LDGFYEDSSVDTDDSRFAGMDDGRSVGMDDGRSVGMDDGPSTATDHGRFIGMDDARSEVSDESRSAGSRWGELGGRLARVFVTQERRDADEYELEPGQYADDELLANDPGTVARFPVGPFGYNRGAVDQHLAEVEHELEQLRTRQPQPLSITEEIERLGEQTASILVVAHDQASETTRRAQEHASETTRRAQEQASETTRRAQEQADRCIADAASNAVAITEQAKHQLRELDTETDAVWQERQRLIDDARTTAAALAALAEEAAERFPADDKPSVDFPARLAVESERRVESTPAVAGEDTPTVDFPMQFQE
jgi:cell division septum initiation protein DivIVA